MHAAHAHVCLCQCTVRVTLGVSPSQTQARRAVHSREARFPVPACLTVCSTAIRLAATPDLWHGFCGVKFASRVPRFIHWATFPALVAPRSLTNPFSSWSFSVFLFRAITNEPQVSPFYVTLFIVFPESFMSPFSLKMFKNHIQCSEGPCVCF